jgi:hypothetical protein
MDAFPPDLEIRDTAYGGRGVFVRTTLPAGQTLAISLVEPLAHVVYREYRKETCAECFAYDSGRKYRFSAASGAAFFCNEPCHDAWVARAGDVGCRAWTAIEAHVQRAPRALETSDDDDDGAPEKRVIQRAWEEAQRAAGTLDGSQRPKAQARSRATILAAPVDPDALGFLLCGVISLHSISRTLADLRALAAAESSYKHMRQLRAHTSAFLVLRALVPEELKPVVTIENLRALASRDACNSFGLWDDGTGGQGAAAEMLGFGTRSPS